MMPRALACLVLLAACRAAEFGAPTEGGDVGDLVEVRGVVVDSVTRARLPGLSVAMAGHFTVTDRQGEFVLMAPAGTDTVHVAAAGYEPFGHPVAVAPAAGAGPTVQLQLRRLAPFPLQCTLGDSGFRAVIVDLQGRKSLERWSQSTLTLVTATGTRTIPAPAWNYTALDYMDWQVAILDASPSTVRADWVLFDSDGNAFRGSCEPETLPPIQPPA